MSVPRAPPTPSVVAFGRPYGCQLRGHVLDRGFGCLHGALCRLWNLCIVSGLSVLGLWSSARPRGACRRSGFPGLTQTDRTEAPRAGPALRLSTRPLGASDTAQCEVHGSGLRQLDPHRCLWWGVPPGSFLGVEPGLPQDWRLSAGA